MVQMVLVQQQQQQQRKTFAGGSFALCGGIVVVQYNILLQFRVFLKTASPSDNTIYFHRNQSFVTRFTVQVCLDRTKTALHCEKYAVWRNADGEITTIKKPAYTAVSCEGTLTSHHHETGELREQPQAR